MKPDICIYHGGCADGFGAAWAVWRKWGDEVQYVPAKYGDRPPEVTGRVVVIVDFSYPRETLVEMAYRAAAVVVLDHHKSAREDLEPLVVTGMVTESDAEAVIYDRKTRGTVPLLAAFDMERSGAVMAWQFFHPETEIPWLLKLVQDRDLWRFDLEDSRAMHSWIMSYPFRFELWSEFVEVCERKTEETQVTYAMMTTGGNAINRKHMQDIENLLGSTKRYMQIGAYSVPVANLPYTMASDAAHKLAEQGEGIGATYYDNNDGQRVFSLRSSNPNIDVSLVAGHYGGGGHHGAAGFVMPIGWEGDLSNG